MGKCVSTGKKAHFMSLSKKKLKPEKQSRFEKRGKKGKGKQDPLPEIALEVEGSPIKSMNTETK